MASVGEIPSSTQTDKPVIVRVKRKLSQTPLEALWLEINDRPAKRALLDFANLSLSGTSSKEEPKSKKVLVQHVDTVKVSETTVEIVKSIVTNSSETSEYNAKGQGRRFAYKRENKQHQLIFRARQEQEVLAKSARFEQIWRSRKGDKEATHDENVREMYQFYDVVRVDTEERSSVEVQKQEEMSLEDQKLLSSYLPLIREHIPDAAADIETEIDDYISHQASTDDYVYDYYAIKDNMDMDLEDEENNPFPLVQVEEDENWFGETDELSDDESFDSNAENYVLNDYPDEDEFDEEDEDDEDSNTSDSDHESEQEESSSDNLVEPENSLGNDVEGAEYYSDNYADGLDNVDTDCGDFDVGYDYDDFDSGNDADDPQDW